ncbi:MAG TPA: PASTA domain-containing protein [Solirubrobacteraceae bacterium]|nr:PASTA domain-containing protein [Solirubrobacteraceae bacterium]
MLSTDLRKLREGWVEIPFCALAEPEEAVARVRTAGVTNDIEVVPAPRPYLDGAPGRVTGTQPRDGELVAPGEKVTIWVNPGQVAPLSDRDLRVIELLQQQADQQRAEREQIFIDSPSPRRNPDPPPSVRALLTADMLAQLDDRLRDAGALLPNRWRPGLSDARIDALLLPAGIDLPEEARLWWRWQNGQEITPDGRVHTLGGRQVPPLEYVVEWYENFRGIHHAAFGVDGLLLALMEQPVVYFDCSRGSDEPVPVYTIGHGDLPRLVLASIGDLVLAIHELLDCEAWFVDSEGIVRSDWEKKPEHLGFL